MKTHRPIVRLAGLFVVLVMAVAGLSACSDDADVASKNLSKDADNFKIFRQVVFYNGITGEYIAEVDGFCSIDPSSGGRVSVTCKLGEDKYVKNYLGLSDNVTYFALQTVASDVSTQRYKITFKPSTVIPDINLR